MTRNSRNEIPPILGKFSKKNVGNISETIHKRFLGTPIKLELVMTSFQILISCMAVTVLAGYIHHEPEVHYVASYHGPPAPLGHDGRVVDTPEVAHAKGAFFHAYHEQLSKTASHGHHDLGHEVHHEVHHAPVHHVTPVEHHHVDYHHPEPHHVYHGPPAPLAHDGRVVDTAEVAHAKAAHFHAYADELTKTAPHHDEPEPHHGGGGFSF